MFNVKWSPELSLKSTGVSPRSRKEACSQVQTQIEPRTQNTYRGLHLPPLGPSAQLLPFCSPSQATWQSTPPATPVKDQLLVGGTVGGPEDHKGSNYDSGSWSVRMQ